MSITESGDDVARPSRVTVARLVQRAVELEWHETIAVALEIADVAERAASDRLPPYDEIEITADGTVAFVREASRPADSLSVLADIVRALLPTDAPEHVWALVPSSGPDAPIYGSLADFAAALRYYDRPDRKATLQQVHHRAVDTSLPVRSGEPTVSSTGPAQAVRLLGLDEIQVPASVVPRVSEEAVAAVRARGLVLPLLVLRRDPTHELIAGVRWFAAAKAAGLTRVPCHVIEVTEDEATALAGLDGLSPGRGDAAGSMPPDWSTAVGPTLGEIADSLGAAKSCWGLSADGAARPYYRTVSEVTRVELQRAIWLVEGLRVLGDRPVITKNAQNLGSLLDRVFQVTRSERRLANTRLLANLAGASIVVSGDERLLVMAYGGTLQAMLAVVAPSTPAVVRCQLTTRGSDALVEYSQDAVGVDGTLLTRFFDESYHGRAGGYGAAVSLAAANRVMELHGGSAQVEASSQRGCRVTLALPL